MCRSFRSKLKIYIDKQEKIPLDFSVGGSVSNVDVTHLPFGDYWCSYETGETMPIVFERKAFGDLFGTLSGGMERFKRELERAKQANFKLIIVIEGTLSEVLVGSPHSTVKGEQIVKTLNTLWVKYDIPHLYFPNRSEMKRQMIETWSAVGRNFKPTGVPSAKSAL